MHVHIVMVKLHDPDTAEECMAAMRSMEGLIEGMIGLDCRRNELDSPFAHDVMLLTRWTDLDAYRIYQTHPVHTPVAELVRSLMSSAATMDWTAPDP